MLRMNEAASIFVPWPATLDFVSRESEMKVAQRHLKRDGVLVLTGAPGSGKSWLAARLGQDHLESQRIWLDCRYLASNFTNITWLLSHNIGGDAWERVQTESLDIARIGQLTNALSQGAHLVCFDALHWRYDDPMVVALVRSLASCAASKRTGLRMIITASYPPPFLSEFGYIQLAGIERDATAKLFARHNLQLADDLTQVIHTDLGGLPRLIEHTAVHAATQIAVPPSVENEEATVTAALVPVTSQNFAYDALSNGRIATGLLQTFQGLSRGKQQVLIAVALFEDYVHLEVLKAALAGDVDDNVYAALIQLCSQGLLLTEASDSKRVTLTPVMRTFYRNMADPAMQQRMHHRIAEHFSWEGNMLSAACHYLEAGEAKKAAKLLLKYPHLIHSDTQETELHQLISRLLSLAGVQALSAKIRGALEQTFCLEDSVTQ